MVNNSELSMKASGMNAPSSLWLLLSHISSKSQGELIYHYLWHPSSLSSFLEEGERVEASEERHKPL